MCAVLRDGTARCWGNNASGQLGDGSTMNRLMPVPVAQLSDVRFLDLGNAHGCAALASGAARCWGANAQGELGTGSASPATAPTALAVKDLSGLALVFANREQTCSVSRAGVAHCWGKGFLNGPETQSLVPVAVSVSHNTTWIAIGAFHSCSLHGDGMPRCWGTPIIASGDPMGPTLPAIVTVPVKVTSFAVGIYSTFFLGADGVIRYFGQGTNTNMPIVYDGFGAAAALDSGLQMMCALLRDGTVSCTGMSGITPVAGLDLW